MIKEAGTDTSKRSTQTVLEKTAHFKETLNNRTLISFLFYLTAP